MLLDERFSVETSCSRRWQYRSVGVVIAAAMAMSLMTLRPASAANAQATEAKADAAKAEPKKAESAPKAEALTYTGVVVEKGTGKPISGATVTVRRRVNAPYEQKTLEEPKYQTNAEGKYTFTIPPEQVAERFLYIELDVTHPDYPSKRGFGYALSMIRKNETLGERPFFEKVELVPAESITGTVVTPEGKPAQGITVLGFSMLDRSDFETASFTRAVTDEKGLFRLNVAKGGPAVFWLLPKEYAPSTHVVDRKRGDVGQIVLEKGIVVQGRVLGAEGKPVAGVWVNAAVTAGPALKKIELQVADALRRSALTNEKGEFKLSPLPAGEISIRVGDYPDEYSLPDHSRRPPPAVFGPQHVTLKQGEAPAPVEIRTIPQVIVEGQYFDSSGKPRLGHEPNLWGKMPAMPVMNLLGLANLVKPEEQYFYIHGVVDKNGKFTLRAPKGLEAAKLSFITNEHSALRVRMKKDAPLGNQTREIDLGKLDKDVQGIEAVRYEAPILLIKPVGADGKLLADPKVKIEYSKDRSPMQGGRFVKGYDVAMEKQTDGHWRTTQLLPDEEFTATVESNGYESKSEKFKLREGEVKAVEFKLKAKG